MSQPAPAHGFDAASLLNPKASTKQAKPAKTQPQQELPIDGDEEMGQASFLEQRFGVQHREHKLNMGSNNETEEHGSENDQPKKKQKMDKDIPTDGPMGKALKDHRKEIAERRNETPAAFRERQPQANGSGVVDLTGGVLFVICCGLSITDLTSRRRWWCGRGLSWPNRQCARELLQGASTKSQVLVSE